MLRLIFFGAYPALIRPCTGTPAGTYRLYEDVNAIVHTNHSLKIMLSSVSFLIVTILFATSPERAANHRKGRRKSNGIKNERQTAQTQKTGRYRYGRGGERRQKPTKNSIDNTSSSQSELQSLRLPPLTAPDGPRPCYFTCRHSYEEILIDEIKRHCQTLDADSDVYNEDLCSSPCPGLVRVKDGSKFLPELYDPVYALQTLPHSVVVSGKSIKIIAKNVLKALVGGNGSTNEHEKDDGRAIDAHETFRLAPRGSLAIHGLVPGMCKGQRNPVMFQRSQKVASELADLMRKSYPAARKVQVLKEGEIVTNLEEAGERWVLQVMLQSNELAVASLTKCEHVGPGLDAYWPNWYHPCGLAKVDIEETMPSSAYRKLMEALEVMRIRPSSKSQTVDLGACPGGWTAVLRRLGSQVTAIDRSKLVPNLMDDDMVEFVKGDAFTFQPESILKQRVNEEHSLPHSWMVSDVIAYPERATELLDRWCGGHWVTHLVVTMKFQGKEPSFDELDHAIQVAKSHGYSCRAKHFFNNKNEVTLMASEMDMLEPMIRLESNVVGQAMYSPTIPNVLKNKVSE